MNPNHFQYLPILENHSILPYSAQNTHLSKVMDKKVILAHRELLVLVVFRSFHFHQGMGELLQIDSAQLLFELGFLVNLGN